MKWNTVDEDQSMKMLDQETASESDLESKKTKIGMEKCSWEREANSHGKLCYLHAVKERRTARSWLR